jgi:1,4-alpha-glucan branching enzyme
MRAVSVLSLLVALLTAPPDVKASSDGQYEVFFHYQAPAGTKTVFLAGEFNNWKTDAQKMDGPDGKGLFTTKLTLKPGRYEYKYVLEGKIWRQDPANPRQAGYFHNSVLFVPGQADAAK